MTAVLSVPPLSLASWTSRLLCTARHESCGRSNPALRHANLLCRSADSWCGHRRRGMAWLGITGLASATVDTSESDVHALVSKRQVALDRAVAAMIGACGDIRAAGEPFPRALDGLVQRERPHLPIPGCHRLVMERCPGRARAVRRERVAPVTQCPAARQRGCQRSALAQSIR